MTNNKAKSDKAFDIDQQKEERAVIELKPEDVTRLARIEQAPEAAVKAAMQAFGSNRAKVVATLRSRKTTLH